MSGERASDCISTADLTETMSSIEETPKESTGLQRDVEPNTQPTSFLDLPGEIRLRIYYFLTVPADGLPKGLDNFRLYFDDHPNKQDPYRFAPSHYFSTPLMRTCRQLHDETVFHYYSHANRLLHIGNYKTRSYLWPKKEWPFIQHGLPDIELILQSCPCSFHERIMDSFYGYYEESPYAKINRLTVHHDLRYDHWRACRNPHRLLRELKRLVGRVNEVVVGNLLDKDGEVDVKAYRVLKDVMHGVPKWTILHEDENRFNDSDVD